MRQRFWLIAAVVIGGYGLLWCRPWLAATDGADGLTLTRAAAGWGAVGMVALASLPALLLGWWVAWRGHPLAGLWTVTASWTVLMSSGGSIGGWMRQAALPGAYRGLLIESLVWLALLLAVAVGLQALRRMSLRWHPSPGSQSSPRRLQVTQITWPGADALVTFVVTAVIGAVVGYVLIRSSQSGQVVGGLLIAFTLAGLIAQITFPQVNNALGIIVAPLGVALAAYGYTLWSYHSHTQVLAAWYKLSLPGLALALPLHYAAAGVTGAILGLTWAQTLFIDGHEPGTQADAAPAPVPTPTPALSATTAASADSTPPSGA